MLIPSLRSAIPLSAIDQATLFQEFEAGSDNALTRTKGARVFWKNKDLGGGLNESFFR
jgi:hypothetical protein